MTSSTDSPILIDSDHDSDVEILHEEKNVDLDIIFVSETISVKEESKTTSLPDGTGDEPKPIPSGNEVGFSRTLSISTGLDVTLRLSDAPLPHHTDPGPLDLSSKTEYDDISDSSDEDSLSSDDGMFNDNLGLNQINVSSFPLDKNMAPMSVYSSVNYNCVPKTDMSTSCNVNTNFDNKCGFLPQVQISKSSSDDIQGSACFPCVRPWESSTLSLTNDGKDSLHPQGSNDLCSSTQRQSVIYPSKSAITNSLSKPTVNVTNSIENVSSFGQYFKFNQISNSNNCSVNANSSGSANLTYIDSAMSSKTIDSTSANTVDSVVHSSHSNNTTPLISDADKLLQDLDFLNSSMLGNSGKTMSKDLNFPSHANSSLLNNSSTCPKLGKFLSSPGEQSTSVPVHVPVSGVKRTMSEQNLKLKSDDKVLPPKKQTRYLHPQSSEETCASDKCSQCLMSLLGCKMSKCLQGHPSCTTCLEEKVKVVLTAKAKESLHCLKPGCDSFFPLSELNHSLPKMVVDILETKLDDDYIDYIASMILKNATSSDDSGQNESSDKLPDLADVKRSNQNTDSSKEKNKDLPNYWTAMDKKKTYELVNLEPESPEYVDVVFKFHESMKFPVADIVKIFRIQNPILWQYYIVKRSQMVHENEGVDVEERRLFHGTQTSVVDSICKKGFDWRVCGKNGTVYGQGSYFAANSSYSHQYTDKGNRARRPPHHPGSYGFKPPPAHSGLQSPFAPMMTGHSAFQNPSRNPFRQYIQSQPSVANLFPLQNTQNLPINPNILQQSCLTFGSQASTQNNVPVSVKQSTVNPQGQQISNQNVSAPLSGPVSVNIPGTSSSAIQRNTSNTPTVLEQMVAYQKNTSNTPTVLEQMQAYLRKRVNSSQTPVNANFGNYGQPQIFFGQDFRMVKKPEEEEKALHKMILSRVLVGRFTGGHANLRKPPPLFPQEDPYGKCYDSCVDNISEPKIFVIFDSTQAYPEYLIEYNMMSD